MVVGVAMSGMEVLALAGVLVLVALGLAWYFWFMGGRYGISNLKVAQLSVWPKE